MLNNTLLFRVENKLPIVLFGHVVSTLDVTEGSSHYCAVLFVDLFFILARKYFLWVGVTDFLLCEKLAFAAFFRCEHNIMNT